MQLQCRQTPIVSSPIQIIFKLLHSDETLGPLTHKVYCKKGVSLEIPKNTCLFTSKF
jgi:hypothetical protein